VLPALNLLKLALACCRVIVRHIALSSSWSTSSGTGSSYLKSVRFKGNLIDWACNRWNRCGDNGISAQPRRMLQCRASAASSYTTCCRLLPRHFARTRLTFKMYRSQFLLQRGLRKAAKSRYQSRPDAVQDGSQTFQINLSPPMSC
jgi:hypothetical protein